MNLLTQTPLVSYHAQEIRQIADLRSVFSHTILQSRDLSFCLRPVKQVTSKALRIHGQVLGQAVFVDVSETLVNTLLESYALTATNTSLDALRLMLLIDFSQDHLFVTDLEWVTEGVVQLQAYEVMNQEALPWFLGFSETSPAVLRVFLQALAPVTNVTTLPLLAGLPIALPLTAAQVDWPVDETIVLGDVILLEGV